MTSLSRRAFSAQPMFLLLAGLAASTGQVRAQCPQTVGFTLVPTPVSSTAIDLFWQLPPGVTSTGYRVFEGTSPGIFTQVANPSVPMYTATNQLPGTTYYFAIHATSNGSVLTAEACATTPALPLAPTISTVSPSQTSVTLTWAANLTSGSLALTKFIILRGATPSTLAQIAAVQGLSYTDQNLASGTTYYYLVRAVDAFKQISPGSALVEATTLD